MAATTLYPFGPDPLTVAVHKAIPRLDLVDGPVRYIWVPIKAKDHGTEVFHGMARRTMTVEFELVLMEDATKLSAPHAPLTAD